MPKCSFYLKQDFVNNQNSNCGEPEPKENGSIQANVADAFTGFDSGDFPIKGLINYRTFYSTANGNTSKTLRNPIILIDGFDPKNTRKIEDCDCAANPECLDKNKSGDNFDPEKHLSIVDAMGYFDPLLSIGKSVLTDLRANGFDVIIVDQPSWEILHPTIPTKLQYNPRTFSYVTVPNMIKVDGGADYVERNAMALVALLKDVKAKVAANGSNSKTVIFSPSMGGLISRYALAYMEKKFAQTGNTDWKHNTKLWVSIDSPHLGANVPMGDQSLLDHVKGSSNEAKVFYDEKLRSPAAQEMLIEQHREYNGNYNVAHPAFLNAQTTSQNMPQNSGNSVFQQHFFNQSNNGVSNSNGFPVDLRKIALVNGSLTGSKNTVNIIGQQTTPFANDGEAIINMRGFQRINIPVTVGYGFLSYTFTITIRTLIAVLESYNMPATGTNGRLSRFKSGFPDVTTQAFNANNRGCMDNVPGGFFKAQELIATPVMGQDPINEGNYNTSALLLHSISTALGGSYWDVHAYNPRHSFIPTFSSLAILNPNQNWNNPLNTNLACPSNRKTPFDSYYGERNNSEHTSFNKGMVDYLMKELGNPRSGIPPTPQAPYFPIDQSALVGPNTICINATATYNFPDICKVPSEVIWTISPNAQILTPSGYSVIIKGLTNGAATLTATFQNGLTITKTIWVGKPTIASLLQTPISPAASWDLELNVNNIQNVTSVTYTKLSGNGSLDSFGNYCELSGSPTIAWTITIQITLTNNCGSTIIIKKYVNPDPDHNPHNNLIFDLYPNPTNSIINICLQDIDEKPIATSTITAELFDIMDQPRRKVEVLDNIATINVEGLPKGIYILKINIDGSIESHQVAIE